MRGDERIPFQHHGSLIQTTEVQHSQVSLLAADLEANETQRLRRPAVHWWALMRPHGAVQLKPAKLCEAAKIDRRVINHALEPVDEVTLSVKQKGQRIADAVEIIVVSAQKRSGNAFPPARRKSGAVPQRRESRGVRQ
jgi:hypothetical protein